MSSSSVPSSSDRMPRRPRSGKKSQALGKKIYEIITKANELVEADQDEKYDSDENCKEEYESILKHLAVNLGVLG